MDDDKLRQLLDKIDDSAKRHHAHIQHVASDWLGNVDRVLQQMAALSVWRNADLSRLKEIGGSSFRSDNIEVANGNAAKTNADAGQATSNGRDDGRREESIPRITTDTPEASRQPVRRSSNGIGRALGIAAAFATPFAIAALAYSLLPNRETRDPVSVTAPSDQSLYQYLEDMDAHLPP